MSTDGTITVTYGSRKAKRSSMRLILMPLKDGSDLGKVSFGNGGRRVLANILPCMNSVSGPSIHNDYALANGETVNEVYTPAEGAMLGYRMVETLAGSVVSHAMVCLRLRESAPFISLNALLREANNSLWGASTPVFKGRADVLTVADLRALGIDVPKALKATVFDPDNVAESFDIVEMRPGTAKPEFIRVANASGEDSCIALPTAPPRRFRSRPKR